MMSQVLCLGEALIDWLCPERGATLAQATTFVRAPGGAPANVAVGLARLGVPTGFVGRLSADPWGTALLETLQQAGVETAHVVRDPETGTRMAYILLDEAGDRHLAAFSLGACADARLASSDLRPEQFDGVEALYIGSLMQAHAGTALAVERAVGLAQEEGAIVVYDPNYRPVLWGDPERARETITATAGKADVVKLGAEELAFLTGESDWVSGARAFQERCLPALLVVTDGARGCYYVRDADEGHLASPEVAAVDPTGAGDGFVAGLLAGLIPVLNPEDARESVATLEASVLKRLLYRANAVGALVATRTGAMTALPTVEELERWLVAQPGGAREDLGWS